MAEGPKPDSRPARSQATEPTVSATPSPTLPREPQPRLLVLRQGPNIQVEATGPERLLTGQAADYTVRVRNSGDAPAEHFVLQITLPGWVELAGSRPSAGEVESVQQLADSSAGSTRQLYWRIPQLPPQVQETLELRLLPRRSQSLDLAVSWRHEPAGGRAVIQVQEPKLELRLATGRELIGRLRQSIEIRLANRGTAPAENVHLRLSVDGAADISPSAVQLTQVAVGEEKPILVDISPLRAGSVTLTCQAAAQGGFHTQFSERLIVREPQLVARWQVPDTLLVDTEVDLLLLIENRGDAPAEATEVVVDLPLALQLVNTPSDVVPVSDRGQLVWKVGTVAPQEEKALALRLRPRSVGRVTWTAAVRSGPWQADAPAAVEVQGFAHLHLVLRDPGRPSPVGAEVPYEIVVENRGTKSLEACEVVVFFSWGIEPVAAEGAPAIIAPGQVIFGRVGPFAPGEAKTLRVVARAESPGTHACRAEVSTPEMPARLVAQQLTLFYQTNAPHSQRERALAGGSAPGGQSISAKTKPESTPVTNRQAEPSPAEATEPTPRLAREASDTSSHDASGSLRR